MLGYDTLAKEHVTMWVDSSSPYLSISRGTMKDGVITLTSKSPDFMSGEMVENKSVVKVGKDTVNFSFFVKDKDGAESKSMMMEYTRKK